VDESSVYACGDVLRPSISRTCTSGSISRERALASSLLLPRGCASSLSLVYIHPAGDGIERDCPHVHSITLVLAGTFRLLANRFRARGYAAKGRAVRRRRERQFPLQGRYGPRVTPSHYMYIEENWTCASVPGAVGMTS
jgi:hypothetical protein